MEAEESVLRTSRQLLFAAFFVDFNAKLLAAALIRFHAASRSSCETPSTWLKRAIAFLTSAAS
jgi:hypothetical protein